jgi:transcriptional regulator with XRE-family HTH domain
MDSLHHATYTCVPRDSATDLDEGAGVDYLDRQIGAGLRNARRRRALTLRQVSALSEGRFKATSVAGYERGERAISLRRFVELAELYGVPPPTLLAEIMRTVEPAPEGGVDRGVRPPDPCPSTPTLHWNDQPSRGRSRGPGHRGRQAARRDTANARTPRRATTLAEGVRCGSRAIAVAPVHTPRM